MMLVGVVLFTVGNRGRDKPKVDSAKQIIGPAGQQTYRAYVLNIPAITATATTATTAIFPKGMLIISD